MKNYFRVLCCVLCMFLFSNFEVRAQYIYSFSSYNFLQYNPAYAGQDTNHCFFLGGEYSSQVFEGLKGAPYTNQFSYAGNFKKFRSALAASGSFSKIGLSTQFDYGIIAYNYNFIINENSNLRVGLNWTERIVHVDFSSMIFNDMNDIDLPLKETAHNFNFDAGFWYTLKKVNLGFSVQNILDKDIQFSSSLIEYEKVFNAIAGYEFLAVQLLKIKPTVIYQNFDGSYSTYLLSNSFVFDNTFILGLGYMIRPSSSANGPLYLEAGAKAGKHVQLMLGYSNMLNKRSYSNETVSAMIKVNLY